MNVFASATAGWRTFMDCECSRKMAGNREIGDRMTNSCLRMQPRDSAWWISGFGSLTVGIDRRSVYLGEQPRDSARGVYREDGFNLFQREIWILTASPEITAKHLSFAGTSVSGYWNLIIRTHLFVEKNLDYLFYCLQFTVSYIDCILFSLVQVIHCPWGRCSRHRRQAAIPGSRLKDSGNLSQASSRLFAAYVVMNSFGNCSISLGSINDKNHVRWNNLTDLSRDVVLLQILL